MDWPIYLGGPTYTNPCQMTQCLNPGESFMHNESQSVILVNFHEISWKWVVSGANFTKITQNSSKFINIYEKYLNFHDISKKKKFMTVHEFSTFQDACVNFSWIFMNELSYTSMNFHDFSRTSMNFHEFSWTFIYFNEHSRDSFQLSLIFMKFHELLQLAIITICHESFVSH